MAKSVGRVQIQLEALTERFQREISKANKTNKRMAAQMKRSGRAANAFGSQIKKLGGLLAGAFGVQALIGYGRRALQMANQVEEASKRTGIAIEGLQAIQAAGQQVGIADTAINMGLQRFNRRLGEIARTGRGELAPALKELDVDVYGVDGQLRATGDVLQEFARKLNAVEDSSVKTSLSMKAFDSEGVAIGVNLGPLLADLPQLTEAMRDMGLVLNEQTVKELADANTEIDIFSKRVSNLFALMAHKTIDPFVTTAPEELKAIQNLMKLRAQLDREDSTLKAPVPFLERIFGASMQAGAGSRGWETEIPSMEDLVARYIAVSKALSVSLGALPETAAAPAPPAPRAIPPRPDDQAGAIFGFTDAGRLETEMAEAAAQRREELRQREADGLAELGLAMDSNAERFARMMDAIGTDAQAKADQMRLVETSVMSIASAFETQLVSAIMTGKFSFEDFARSVLASIAQMIARMLVLRAVTATLGAFMGGQPGDSFGQTIQSPTGSTGAWQGPTFGTGGVVSGRQQVIVGEAGPEAILPMVRRGGKLGVIAAATSGDSEAPSVLPLIRERGLLAVASPSPDLSLPDLPEFATGGVVSGRQQVVVGEAGPEAILPMVRRGGKLGVIAAATSGDSEAPSVLPLIRERGLLAVAPPSPDLSRPDLPEFAMGGVVSGRQQVIVGEAGPEAILPMVRRGGKLGVIAAATSGDSEAPSVLPLIRERGLLAVAPPSPDLSLPDLPEFAMGGVVSGRQQVIVGEAGPEAILPLARRGGKLGVIASPGGGASAPSVNVTIHNAAPHSEPESEQLANMVSRAVRDAWRQQAINESRPGGFFNPVA